MKLGPRYKIARRLGADLFEKTQSPKFAARAARKVKSKKRPPSRSDFGQQLREKQRARILYGLNERQFSGYVAKAIAKKTSRDDEALFTALERRIDNVIFRLGIAPSRQASRQIASHGHITVNDVRITIPSYQVKTGDVIRIRKASEKKPLFLAIADKIRDHVAPPWLRFDLVKGEATIVGSPKLVRTELPFNIAAILEFYRR
ncbi:MAG: 30S ribosomal protein S4 [Candidatus Taylorbacteria bacterium CG11_big_fil_rev_8_21_14_0_20_46_11]|uniref:Small ribosomal subunit protein uS4 n=1 Tax=Candidatus Taylorbacteria bacterium CG11_big_fil_rev_8_21_14_0_20_46_11 TaxID=1975025 RepID=A0A2H0KBF2_9BACT|nr:MAG: 30S ribosomal protein S4 [Candidatus Taylorbacteria bacterium CG11_big_fil_rev_8_21_14_0_20_46_11]